LLYLLGKWDTDDCIADLIGDETVDVFDLLVLLGNWGTCDGYAMPATTSGPGEFDITQTDWEDFWDIIANGTPSERENWSCWMYRYLSRCETCPTCPESDPFRH
jgi:hypothetical protein